MVLTWPENEGDRPVVPSPFLAEFTLLRKAGLINKGMEKTSGIQFSPKLEESHSVPELAKALSLAGTVKGLEDLLNVNIDGMSGIDRRWSSSRRRPRPVTRCGSGNSGSPNWTITSTVPYDFRRMSSGSRPWRK